MTAQDPQNGIDQAEIARAELYDTLSQLRDRLDFAQRVDDRIDRARIRIAAEQLEHPLRFAATVASVAAAAGVAVWGIASAVIRKFE